MKNSKAARVIFPGGEIRQFRDPVKAAELMLDCPTFFLVNSRSLTIGRRFSPLTADEDLEFGNLYVMFPMKRVNSVATAADVAVFLMAAKSAAKRISSGNVRISPESGGDLEETPATTVGIEVGGVGFPVPEYRYRLSACRSRRPMLDTITEEPLSSR
ncbi:hypothetical protein RHSIM_Rhsim09G0068600 [Rhododendron simsii]|uniref:DUF4228 domain protein n=1 Tax=Rhododendron simsii TaxID=118357 RepID=A0A834LFE6_RHOSS|nr:hypothetical protein RHSIM_Rhsim09G0068600 [Rhododendron simsii]